MEIIKIMYGRATVTVYICTVTVALVYLCTILHPLMWVFFGSKCVKRATFCILQDYPWTDVVALRNKVIAKHACLSMSKPLPIPKKKVSMHEMNIFCKIENQEAVSKGV